MNDQYEKTYVIGMCGASGAIYGIRLLKALLEKPFRIYLIISKAGYSVLKHEIGFDGTDINALLESQGIVKHNAAALFLCDNDDYFMSPASGSFRHNGMVISPCSMKTLGAIANGMCDNLLSRSADVALKEKRPLILLPRETPLNLIHIKNMESALLAGATIMPPVLPFYGDSTSITAMVDTFTGRILDHLNVKHSLYQEWGQQHF
jgi:flavin prenyltransferase